MADALGFGAPVLICIKQRDLGRGFSPPSLGFSFSICLSLPPPGPPLSRALCCVIDRGALWCLLGLLSSSPSPQTAAWSVIYASVTLWSRWPEVVAPTLLQPGELGAEGRSEESEVDGAGFCHLSQPRKVK